MKLGRYAIKERREEEKIKQVFSAKAVYKQRGFKKLYCCLLLCKTSSRVPVSLPSL